MKKLFFFTICISYLAFGASQVPIDTFPLLRQYGPHPNYQQLFNDMDAWTASNPGDTLYNLEQFERDRNFMETRLDQNGSMKGYDKTRPLEPYNGCNNA